MFLRRLGQGRNFRETHIHLTVDRGIEGVKLGAECLALEEEAAQLAEGGFRVGLVGLALAAFQAKGGQEYIFFLFHFCIFFVKHGNPPRL